MNHYSRRMDLKIVLEHKRFVTLIQKFREHLYKTEMIFVRLGTFIFAKKKAIEHLAHAFADAAVQKDLETVFLRESASLQVKGWVGSGMTLHLASAFEQHQQHLLLVCEDREKAAYHLNDLEQLLGNARVLFFPSSYRKPYQTETTDNANVLLRSEVLDRLTHSSKARVVVTYPQALFEKVVSQSTLKKNTLEVVRGSNLSPDFVNEVLFDYRFERVDFVAQPGEFSVRGGIIDVFSFANQHPYRIEFFDDEVESLRSFDVATQLSIATHEKIKLLPNTSEGFKRATRKSLMEIMGQKGVIALQELDSITARLHHYFTEAQNSFAQLDTATLHLPPEQLFLSEAAFREQLSALHWINASSSSETKAKKLVLVKQSPQPAFHRKFDQLIAYLNDNHSKGYTNFIACSTAEQAQRLGAIFEEMEETVHYKTVVIPLFEGFEDVAAKVAVFTDHQIFERYHKYQLKSGYTKKQALTLKELTHLEVGDYVTHIDHGIGRFGGLKKLR